MATASVCGPCSKSFIITAAFKHCTDCGENLCSICVDVHSTFKAFQTHHVFFWSLGSDNPFKINKFCAKHPELTLELFCPDHDVLCCRVCMTERHRSCDKLSPVEMTSKGVKSSSMFDNISKRVVHLTETGHQFTDKTKNIEAHLKESKASALKKAFELKDEFLRRIDKMYGESVSEINETYARLLQKVEKNKKTVTEKVQNAWKITKKFETVSKQGSEGQIFLLMHLLKVDLTNSEEDLREAAAASFLKTWTVSFEKTYHLSLMRSFGSVTVQEQDLRFQFKPVENQRAQMNCPSQVVPTTFKLHKNVSYRYDKDIFISGMCITEDGRFILCNSISTSKDILVLSCNGQYVHNIELEYCPWNIIIEQETGDAWVTMPHASYVKIIDTKTMSVQRRVNIVRDACGIAFVGINLAVSTKGKVEIYSKQGIHVKTIQCRAGYIDSLCYKDNMLYCADDDSNTIIAIHYICRCVQQTLLEHVNC